MDASNRPAAPDAPADWTCVECGHEKASHRFGRCRYQEPTRLAPGETAPVELKTCVCGKFR